MPRHFTSSLFPGYRKPAPTSCPLTCHSRTSRTGGGGKKAESVSTTLREGHCLPAYPGRDAQGLNLPEPIRGDRERDLRETTTTKTVCDKAEAPQSERSEIKCDIFHLFVNASLAAHSLETTVGLLPS
ncbi:Valine--tRNA ligase [Dissostichus eleginoides]|uniref:Valine--tRNA ligase n=1 Tax=Dissostichus eleginoides TaxID=100907 RepID=A0AAD9C9K7_DISEL|nr:Valine--tRNA ligase [Dissostichus eleginoides]